MYDISSIDAIKERMQALVYSFCPEEEVTLIFGDSAAKTVGNHIYLREPYEDMPLEKWRGETDRAILKYLYYDAKKASDNSPSTPLQRELYALLLEFFCDVNGIHHYPGMFINIHSFYQKYTDPNPLFYAIIHNLYPPLMRDISIKDPSFTQKQLTALQTLSHSYHDFESYAACARELCDILLPSTNILTPSASLPSPATHKKEVLITGDSETLCLDTQEDDLETDNSLTDQAVTQNIHTPPTHIASEDFTPPTESHSYEIEFAQDEFERFSPHHFQKYRTDYSIFTKEFDQITPPQDLYKNESERIELQTYLDTSLETYRKVTHKLSAKLRAKLLSYQFSLKDHGRDTGKLNTKALPSLIMDPLYDRIFKDNNPNLQQDIGVTLLIDCSGSMRGRPMTMAATSAYLLADTLDKCHVKTEILGFTTHHWRGGESKKKWEKKGSPPLPGRLNDLLYIPLKTFYSSWRHSKKEMNILLKESLLKENIDGEALLWAHQRLLKQTMHRKILLVISDGAPVDDQTSSANDAGFLERHLQYAIDYIEKKSPVELMAIGIGHDVSQYYKNAITLKNADNLGEALLTKFIDLFEVRS